MTPPSRTLSAIAEASMRAYFAAKQPSPHRPSDDHWAALRAILNTCEDMANDQCAPNVYLSAVDPGVGKTTAVTHFAAALLASANHANVGMIITVGRISEAADVARALGAFKGHVAVLTSDPETNALGGVNVAEDASGIDGARLLVTTQQKLERVTAHRSFNDAQRFFYQGRPRAVRVWDESFAFGRAVSLNKWDIHCVVAPLAKVNEDCAEDIERFIASMPTMTHQSVIDVPDWNTRHDGALLDLVTSLSEGPNDDRRNTAEALMILNGNTAFVTKEGKGNVALTYRDTLPDDLAPLLVLDASVRVRHAYEHMARHRPGIVMLPSAVKDYRDLAVNVWATGGGKGSFQTHGKKLVEGIVNTVLREPKERWLVVTHVRVRGLNIVNAIRDKLNRAGVPAGNVAFLTWGRHMATNLHKDVGRVILAGVLSTRPSHYVAMTQLAQAHDLTAGPVSRDDVNEIRTGENANLILQAICRGAVRNSNGNRCWPMKAFIIAHPRSGIRADLARIFPSCRVGTWAPAEKPLDPRTAAQLDKADRFLTSALASGATEVTVAAVASALGMDKSNFANRIGKLPAWRALLNRLDLATVAAPGKAKVLRHVTAAIDTSLAA